MHVRVHLFRGSLHLCRGSFSWYPLDCALSFAFADGVEPFRFFLKGRHFALFADGVEPFRFFLKGRHLLFFVDGVEPFSLLLEGSAFSRAFSCK